jgi:hypothetical protein
LYFCFLASKTRIWRWMPCLIGKSWRPRAISGWGGNILWRISI